MQSKAIKSSRLIIWTLFIGSFIVNFHQILAYSNGAPNGEACRTLYPGHGVDKQYGRSNYRIHVSHRFNDSKIIVTLYSPTDTFLGFIMQARLHTDREMLVNGVFSTNEHTQALNCLGGYQNTLTHVSAYPKYKIETTWTAPKNFFSDIVFRVTVVQSKNIFWTTIDSDVIELSPSSSSSSSLPPNQMNNNNQQGGINTFNIHNDFNQQSPPSSIPSGFVVNKEPDSVSKAPYNVALSSLAITPPSQYSTVSQQSPLVQSYPLLSRYDSNLDLAYYLDYNVCARKLCFGLPNGCLRKRNCLMLLTSTIIPYTDSTVEFEIIADHRSSSRYRPSSFNYPLSSPPATSTSSLTSPSTSAYYSLAFSHDKQMGNDSVTDCLLVNGRPELSNSINLGKTNEELTDGEFHGVTVINTTYTNGILYCKWRKRRRFTLRGTRFDLRDNRYHLMLAYGRLASFSGYKRKEPHFDKIVSDSMVDFRMTGPISAYSKMFLVKFHAAFMIIAWVGFVSIGIMTARYLKPLWISHSLFGVRIWFAVHRSSMLAALIFASIGIISIFLYVDGFSMGFHQMFGFAAIFSMIINPIGAVFRPDCESSKRWIFNWIHWLIGNLGYLSAVGALFLAFQLTTIRLQPPYLWSIAFYLFFNLTVHSLLQLYFCNCHHNKDTGDISDGSIPGSSTNTNQRIDSLADTAFLRYFFMLYSAVIWIFVIVIISFTFIN
ncbi:Putative ferric-chelate reductase 1 -like protein [Sarcoptes scabiei]|uniref:Putative ferric-chelate reductase 1 -like protein n=1 Tax=Sarcoptes scabiei TaxID=52283 RepID=A0A834VDB3_SARSC|nr:Putative ferric-chelate reductase 1 -like protein [Sarcoptes scabiei]